MKKSGFELFEDKSELLKGTTPSHQLVDGAQTPIEYPKEALK